MGESENLFLVGKYIPEFNDLTGQTLPCVDIMQSVGLVKHIRKRHYGLLPYMEKIPEIIIAPDYIGVNPGEPDSIELVKRYSDNIQIAIKLDAAKGYLYVASLYDIPEHKIQKRLYSGRLKRW
ncbi:hypothetical protein CE91St46_07300 [Eubacteriales bacterium]|nr:hypothetical protein CE91St46_07300 [Eubacteriales bacterium]GKH62260.1 hypothetical protein CE91St47_07290 [Eubacteriales bacterium]